MTVRTKSVICGKHSETAKRTYAEINGKQLNELVKLMSEIMMQYDVFCMQYVT